jgi:hypothetical protein
MNSRTVLEKLIGKRRTVGMTAAGANWAIRW